MPKAQDVAMECQNSASLQCVTNSPLLQKINNLTLTKIGKLSPTMPYPPRSLQRYSPATIAVLLAAAASMLLLVWMVPSIDASPIQIRPSGKNTLRTGNVARRRHLTEADRQAIIEDYGLKNEAGLDVQSISPDNTVVVNSKGK